ncbi:MAG: acyl-CoA dehydrogenase family protein, partial [Acidimicrobiales bacterium]
PAEHGGLGLSQLHYGRALALAATWHPAISTMLSAHQSVGVVRPLEQAGTPQQKARWLPLLAKGSISAFLVTEPGAGSDPSRLSTTAAPDGEAYLLNGTKLWGTNAGIAELFFVTARVAASAGHPGGITAFVVDAHAEGVHLSERNHFMGLHGVDNRVVRFDSVRVPRENVLGGEGSGLRIALQALNSGRLALPATSVGTAKWALRMAREWASTRVQGDQPGALNQPGQPIGRHEAIAQKLAFMAASVFGMEAMWEMASLLVDSGTGSDLRVEAALTKLYCTETAWKVADELVQIRGGRGYETAHSLRDRGERPVGAEQLLRDLRVHRIFEGSSEVMHLVVAREILAAHPLAEDAGLFQNPRRAVTFVARAASFYPSWLAGLARGPGDQSGSYAEYGPLGEHLRWVERSSRHLAQQIFRGLLRWRSRTPAHQAFLWRVVDIGAELWAVSAAVVKAQAQAEGEVGEVAELFCRQARRRADRLFSELWRNEDALATARAAGVLEGRYTFLEEGILDPSSLWIPVE